ncbi:MAG: hypothetical protein H6Q31_2392 [Bacteroidetes bacterium]|nr:hypothetical protein [Bacteroidota bacterium]
MKGVMSVAVLWQVLESPQIKIALLLGKERIDFRTAWFLDKQRVSSKRKVARFGQIPARKVRHWLQSGYSPTSNNLKTALFRRGAGI